MIVTDVHTHIFPDRIAATAVPVLAAEANIKAAISGTRDGLLASMDEAGIGIAWIQPVATKPAQVESINRWHDEIRSERLVTFGAIHPDYADIPGLIHSLADRGFPGVKIHPEYQAIEPENERLFPLYEALIERNMMVLFHAGVDIAYTEVHSRPAQFKHVKELFPELTMILAHMGGFRQWDEVEVYLMGLDVYLDTSYVFDDIADEVFLRLVDKHGDDKILYGSDSPWADQSQSLTRLQSLGLSQSAVDNICMLNAQRLLRSRQ